MILWFKMLEAQETSDKDKDNSYNNKKKIDDSYLINIDRPLASELLITINFILTLQLNNKTQAFEHCYHLETYFKMFV